MIVIATVPALVSFLGALAFALSSNAKVSELGRLAYFAGIAIVLYVLAGHVVRLG